MSDFSTFMTQVSLQKIRLFDDHAELLLHANIDHVRKGQTSEQRVYAFHFGHLTEKERSSLRILSPSHHLIDVRWGKAPIASSSIPSRPVPEDVEKQCKVKEAITRLALGRPTLDELSLDALQSELDLSEEIRRLSAKWSVSIDRTLLAANTTDLSRSPDETRAENDVLYLVFHVETSPDLPSAQVDSSSKRTDDVNPLDQDIDSLKGGWIDSIPPIEIEGGGHVEVLTSVSEPITQGIWLRFLIDEVSWSRQMTLFVNGEKGRLTRSGILNHRGLHRALISSSISSLKRDGDVELEWRDETARREDDARTQREPLQSMCTMQQLFPISETFAAHDISVTLNSQSLVSRGLMDIHREHALLEKQRSRQLVEAEDIGYFTDAHLLIMDASSGAEQITASREIKLCSTFLEKDHDQVHEWRLIISGRNMKFSPEHWGDTGVCLRLGFNHALKIHQTENGVMVRSLLAEKSIIGLENLRGEVISEREIQPRGSSELKYSGATVISPKKEPLKTEGSPEHGY